MKKLNNERDLAAASATPAPAAGAGDGAAAPRFNVELSFKQSLVSSAATISSLSLPLHFLQDGIME